MIDASPLYFLAGSVLVLAGFVKGVIGLGLPAIGVGLLSLIWTPAEAAALLVVPNLLTNFWQMVAGGGLAEIVRRMWPLLAGIGLGTVLGAFLVDGAGAPWATGLLGVALAAYAVSGLAHLSPRVPARGEGALGAVIGIATGAVTVATGVFVMPAVPFLHALGLNRDRLVQVLGLSFFVSTVTLASALSAAGILHAESAAASTAALIPVTLGMLIGQWFRARVSSAAFRRWFFLGLLALGIYLAMRSLG